jgi:hypothetical protein
MFKVKEGISLGNKIITGSGPTEVLTAADVGSLAFQDADSFSVPNLEGGNSTTLLGSIPYQSGADVTTMLAPNTTTTPKYLTQTGTGTNGAAPTWGTIVTAGITDDAVTYAKMQNISAQYRILGRISAAAGDTEEVTPDNAITILNQGTTTINGARVTIGGSNNTTSATYYPVFATTQGVSVATATNSSFNINPSTGNVAIGGDLTVSGGDITAGNVAASLFAGNTTTNITVATGLTSGTFTVGATGSTGAVSLFPATGSQAITLGGATTGTITIGSTSATAVQLPTGKTKVGQTTLIQGVNGNITLPPLAGTLATNDYATAMAIALG